jgi:aspartate/methionine/tyrosine aminotransferase
MFPRIEFRGMSGSQFCEYMLREYQVAMIPGEVFGRSYAQHVRISYGGDLKTQRAAAQKIVEVIHAG